MELDETAISTDVVIEAQLAEDALPAVVKSRRMNKEAAATWLRVAATLHEKLGRPTRPADFVSFARRSKSRDAKVLAKQIFHVSAKEAAERYFELTAAFLLRSVIVTTSEALSPTRAIVHVVDGATPGYVPLSAAMSRPDWRAQVLADAARDLRLFRARFTNLHTVVGSQALKRALDAIEVCLQELPT